MLLLFVYFCTHSGAAVSTITPRHKSSEFESTSRLRAFCVEFPPTVMHVRLIGEYKLAAYVSVNRYQPLRDRLVTCPESTMVDNQEKFMFACCLH